MANSLMTNAGASWVLGVAGADRYPTDGIGGATATDTASANYQAKVMLVFGLYVTTAGTTVEIIRHDGSSATVVTGMTFDSSVVGPVRFPAPIKITGFLTNGTGACNIGVRCNGTTVATLDYKKLA